MSSEPKRPNLGMTKQESAQLDWILSQITFAKKEGNSLRVASLRMEFADVSSKIKARQEREKKAYSNHPNFKWLRES